MATREEVLEVLKSVIEPSSGQDIVSAGMVRALTVEEGTVRFVLEAGASGAEAVQPLKEQAETRLNTLKGVAQVSAVMTAHNAPKPPPDIRPRRAAQPQGPQKIPGVDRIVAVASGKGGVGKSTVSANLAAALAARGRRTGLLDADVYGPSQPRMLGISGRPSSPDGKTILPPQNHGITMMSMGLLVRETEAVVWRGPMLMGALQQMLNQVQWGALDVLIVDLPPGTGDVQLTLAQRTELAGAIVVSTPQDIALLDARKAIDMFRKLDVPIMGMVENMSTHVCSRCGHVEHVFGHGGVAAAAKELGVPLLAEIPLAMDVRVAGDGGTPIVASEPESPSAQAFRKLAADLIEQGNA